MGNSDDRKTEAAYYLQFQNSDPEFIEKAEQSGLTPVQFRQYCELCLADTPKEGAFDHLMNRLPKFAQIIFVFAIVLLVPFLVSFFLDQIWRLNEAFFTPVFAVIVLVGMNILAYFASFKWHRRKPWFFAASIVLSTIVVLYAISIFI